MSRDQKSSTEIKGYDLSDNNRVDQNGGLKASLTQSSSYLTAVKSADTSEITLLN